MLVDQGVQREVIFPDDILDIRGVLEAAFDFERAHAGFRQLFKSVFQIVVFE